MATTMLVEDLTNDAYWRGYDAGTENERERIIKLLKEHFDNPESCPCVLCWNFAGTELMTALIKGENK
jgi:hypothetical protein